MLPDAPPPIDVVVQTARLPQAAGDPAFSIVELTPLELSSHDRLDEALDQIPGFSLYRRTSSLGANPTTQGVSLRGVGGSGASRALVTLDGAPQNDPFGGWVIWTALPPESLAGASIVRGAGAGPYGAGALTGTIALEEPTRIPGGVSGDLEGGSLGYERAAGVAETSIGPARVFLDASVEHSDGWIPVIGGRGTVDRPLTLNDWSAAERVETDLGPAALSERVGVYDEGRGAGTLLADSREKGIDGSLALAAQPTPDRPGWRIQGWAQGSDLINTSASVAANRDSATLADDQYATPAVGAGVNGALRWSRPAYSLEVGVDGRDYEGESKEDLYSSGRFTGQRTAGGGEWIAGLYAEGARTLGPSLLTGGVRLDGWRDYGSKLVQTGSTPLDQRSANQGGVVPTGRVGVRRQAGRDLYLRAAAYAGFRPATLNELHRPYRVGQDVTEANAALTPERLYGAEVGAGGDAFATWDADVFFNQLANAVTNVTIGQGPGTFPLAGYVPAGGVLYKRENVGAVNAVGVEGEARKTLAPSLSLAAAFTYTHARVDGGSGDPQLTGRRPALTPEASLTGSLAWTPKTRLKLVLETRYESARFDDDLNTRLIKGGAGTNARLEWSFTRALAGYVAADNVFNADLQTARSASGVVSFDAPRMVLAGLTWRR